jgi:hypothetical protein
VVVIVIVVIVVVVVVVIGIVVIVGIVVVSKHPSSSGLHTGGASLALVWAIRMVGVNAPPVDVIADNVLVVSNVACGVVVGVEVRRCSAMLFDGGDDVGVLAVLPHAASSSRMARMYR